MLSASRTKMAILLAILFLYLILVPGLAEAAVVLTGDTSTIGPGETVYDDLYLFGETVVISGTVLGDVVIFANEAVIDGTVTGSLFAVAQTVRIAGDVQGSIRGGANTIFFQGSTGRDLIMAANTISITGSIGQDYYGAANNSTVSGSVGRNIRTALNRLVIDSAVGGDINAYAKELIFGPGARVDGNVTYTSETDAAIDNQAVITGAMKRLDPPAETIVTSPGRSVWSFIRPILSLLAVALLVVLLFPVLTAGTARVIREQPGLCIGYGALIVFVAPVAALFLMITVIGIPISFLSMLLYTVLIYVTRVFTGYFLAGMVFERFNKEMHPAWIALIGVLILALLIKIPFIGWLIHLAAVLFAAGAFILYMVGKKDEAITMAEPVVDQL